MITVVEMLFFFNPFCRLFINVIEKERENSCDDLVMQFKYDAHVYVMALLSLEKSRLTYHPMAMAAMGKNNKLLLQRVRRITGQKVLQPRLKPAMVFFFLCLVISGGIMQLQFKILPSALNPAVSKTVKKQNANIPDLREIVYTSSYPSPKNKPAGISSIKREKSESESEIGGPDITEEQNLETTDGDRPEEQTSSESVIAADQTETVDFSIQTPKIVQSLPENSAQSDYPYVPPSSFSYQVVPDSSDGGILSAKAIEADAEKSSLKAIESIDWKKIQQTFAKNQTVAIDFKKLKAELRKSLIGFNREKINKGEDASAMAGDASRIKNDLQIQLEALQNLGTGNQQQAKKLEREILQNQLKLRQSYLEQQQLLLKKIKLIKEKKVVYI
jgi:hypothetical protein